MTVRGEERLAPSGSLSKTRLEGHGASASRRALCLRPRSLVSTNGFGSLDKKQVPGAKKAPGTCVTITRQTPKCFSRWSLCAFAAASGNQRTSLSHGLHDSVMERICQSHKNVIDERTGGARICGLCAHFATLCNSGYDCIGRLPGGRARDRAGA